MAKFITGKELEDAVYDIIFNAKKELLIVSPYIKLDDYFRKKLFDKHLGNAETKITIVFGKNKSHIQKSLNLSDFEYFKRFPNISIVYVPNLHAKYFANEKQGIITSINLYDYSFKNNIEYAVLSDSKLLEMDKIYKEVKEKTWEIVNNNNVVFVRRPQYKKKKLIGKDYVGSNTLYDSTDELIKNGKVPKKLIGEYSEIEDKVGSEEIQRVSRQEFEKEKKQVHVSNKKGFCIKCGISIKDNPKVPFCKSCYSKIKKNNELSSTQKKCHLCGKEYKSTLKKPVCYSCYKANKDKYEFAV